MHFQIPSEHLIELPSEHSFGLVCLSILIVIIASYGALTMNQKIHTNSFFHQNIWIVSAAVLMGIGIWSMHFIGMSAYLLPVHITYNWPLTIISILPAMLASFLAFYIVSSPNRTLKLYILAGIIMGFGISSMHYIGMMAIEIDGYMVHNLPIFLISVAIAIIVSFVALYVFSTLRPFMTNHAIHIFTAIILGLAVSSMHYTGMVAVSFHVEQNVAILDEPVRSGKTLFIVSLTLGISFLFGFLLLSSLVDRYIKFQTKFYDPMTRLPNRRLFEKTLNEPVSKRMLAIWHLHNLEKVNREFGYIFGDEVIQRFSMILNSLKPSNVQIYRIEGHRFALLMDNREDTRELLHVLKKVNDIINKPLDIHGRLISLPAVCAWQFANNKEAVLDVYTDVLAVLNDPNIEYNHRVIQYDSSVHTYTFEQEIVSDIDRAMNADELFLVFQPKVHGNSLKVLGVEALLRWEHPKYGFLSPGVFIPILEASDKMLPVTDWVIEKTCQQIAEWKKKNIPIHQVSVNIPGTYVTSSNLLKVLKKSIRKYHLQPSNLELEITETSFVQAIEEAEKAISKIRDEGFSVALDDFGTGVSSLSYLRRMPISTLKIDKSFVDEVPYSKKDSSIIQAIIALATSLNLAVVFEGVESEDQVTFLSSTCPEPIIQGFCFARPMKPSELVEWLDDFNVQYV